MNRRLTVLPLLSALALAAGPAPARAETVNCTQITTLPATITTQGVFCLKKDLATGLASGNAITIATNNVTIDCNGYKLGGLAAGLATQAIGIRAEARMNAVVRNCNVRGFAIGVYLDGSGHVVEDNRLDGNTSIGILLAGDGSLIRGNRVFDTGGSTGSNMGFFGIFGLNDLDIVGNTVSGVAATGGSSQAAVGIYTYDTAAGAVDGNVVRGVVADGAGVTFGMYNALSGNLSLRGNQIVGSDVGTGLACASTDGIASGNHVLGFPVFIDGCQNGGGNVTN